MWTGLLVHPPTGGWMGGIENIILGGSFNGHHKFVMAIE